MPPFVGNVRSKVNQGKVQLSLVLFLGSFFLSFFIAYGFMTWGGTVEVSNEKLSSGPVSPRKVAQRSELPTIYEGDHPASVLEGLSPPQQVTFMRLTDQDALFSSPDSADAMLEILQNPAVVPLIRNGIANRALRYPEKRADMLKVLETAYADASESDVWRDYTVQFAGLLAGYGETAEEAHRFIERVARTDVSSIGGTALIHVARHQKGEAPPWWGQLILSRIGDPEAHVLTRAAAIRLAGEQRQEAALPLVRSALESASDDELKRAALYAMGRLGSAQDLALIAQYNSDPNTAVVMVAKASEASVGRRIRGAR